jgi:hypothetical protein
MISSSYVCDPYGIFSAPGLAGVPRLALPVLIIVIAFLLCKSIGVYLFHTIIHLHFRWLLPRSACVWLGHETFFTTSRNTHSKDGCL